MYFWCLDMFGGVWACILYVLACILYVLACIWVSGLVFRWSVVEWSGGARPWTGAAAR